MTKKNKIMTRDALNKHWDVIEAFKKGAEVEYLNNIGKWENCPLPAFTLNTQYRIKPEQTKRLPTIEEVEQWFMDNKVFKGKTAGGMYRISSIEDKTTILIADAYRNINEFCTKFTHLDGTELYITENE